MAAAAPKDQNELDTEEELPPYHEVSPEEGWQIFDTQARKYLGMSGEEFLRKWDANEIEDPDRSDVLAVAFLIPYFR